jgi:hypothetical protein
MSKVRQLSVFIENKAGRVSEVTGVLGDAGVNIRGFSVSDTADYGILRLVVDKPDEALALLRAAGFTVRETDVIAIDLPDVPGGLAGVLKIVSDAGVNIEYVYSLVSTYVVLNVADADAALRLLDGKPVRLVSQDELARA